MSVSQSLRNHWKGIFTNKIHSPQEQITWVVLLMQAVISGIFTLLVVAGWIQKIFLPIDVVYMLFIFAPALVALWLAYNQRWNIASFIPPVTAYLLGALFTIINGLGLTPLLFFILFLVLSAMLLGTTAQWIAWGLSLTTYVIGSWYLKGEPVEILFTAAVLVGGFFTGISLLLWFSITQLKTALEKSQGYAQDLLEYQKKLEKANQELQLELEERQLVELKLKEYSSKLEQMAAERSRELQQTQEQLIQQEKLAALGELAASVSHEIRNPLGVINNAIYYLEFISEEKDPKKRQYMNLIKSEVKHANQIITDLLTYAQPKTPNPQDLYLQMEIQTLVKNNPPPEGIEVKLDIPHDLPPVIFDLFQFRRVIANLLRNAYQAITESGQVQIRALQTVDHIELQIIDSGTGIPDEHLSHIFEPLFTTKARGIGLGLAICQQLAEANGGRIEVQSEVGKGSTFTLIFLIRGNGNP